MKLAFEYQGEQHYKDSTLFGGNLEFKAKGRKECSLYNPTDNEKIEACENHGITLIHIPYWWDGKKESLMATINSYRFIYPLPSLFRPNLFQNIDLSNYEAIPSKVGQGTFQLKGLFTHFALLTIVSDSKTESITLEFRY